MSFCIFSFPSVHGDYTSNMAAWICGLLSDVATPYIYVALNVAFFADLVALYYIAILAESECNLNYSYLHFSFYFLSVLLYNQKCLSVFVWWVKTV